MSQPTGVTWRELPMDALKGAANAWHLATLTDAVHPSAQGRLSAAQPRLQWRFTAQLPNAVRTFIV